MHLPGKWLFVMVLGMFSWASVAEPVNPDYQSGMTNYYQGDWGNAVTNFTRAIANGYDLYDCYSYRSYSLAKKGDASGAMADCARLMALQPTYAGVYYWRSRVEVALTNFDAGLRDFETGLKMDPAMRPHDLAGDLVGHYLDAELAASKSGKIGDALEDINTAIYINPTNSFPYCRRAWLKIMQGHFDNAIADADLAIKFNPKNNVAYGALAWARYGRGDMSGAVEACRRDIEIESELAVKIPLAKNELLVPDGLLCFINGDFEKAADNWENYLKIQGDNLPQNWKTFLQSWINKAKAAQVNSLSNTNASPPPDRR